MSRWFFNFFPKKVENNAHRNQVKWPQDDDRAVNSNRIQAWSSIKHNSVLWKINAGNRSAPILTIINLKTMSGRNRKTKWSIEWNIAGFQVYARKRIILVFSLSYFFRLSFLVIRFLPFSFINFEESNYWKLNFRILFKMRFLFVSFWLLAGYIRTKMPRNEHTLGQHNTGKVADSCDARWLWTKLS